MNATTLTRRDLLASLALAGPGWVAAQGNSMELAGIAQVGLLLTQNPNIPTIDLGLEDVQQMFAALVQAEVISAAQRDELFASGVHLRSRADVLGLGYVSADDVSRATEA